MKIVIKTAATGCHLSVDVSIQHKSILSLSDSDNGEAELFPGLTYRFEWSVFVGQDNSNINIQVGIMPLNSGLNPFTINKNYSAGDVDGNVFLFTLN